MEDNPADVFLIREALKMAKIDAELYVVHDGEKAIAFLDAAEASVDAPCPDLIVLDINLPKRKGGDVVRHMRSKRRCARTLVLVVTSSDSMRDREEMAALGTSGYFRKPSDFSLFMELGPLVFSLLESRLPPTAQ